MRPANAAFAPEALVLPLERRILMQSTNPEATHVFP